MNHPAELALAQYMTDAANGKAVLSEDTIQRIGKDVMDALARQFGGGNKRGEFGLRMSNICLLYTSPSPRDGLLSRMPSSA